MVTGVSIDVSQLNECYDLIAQNLDIIGHIQIYLDDTPLVFQEKEILKFQEKFRGESLSYSLHSYGYINLCEIIEDVRKGWVKFSCKTLSLAQNTSCVFVNFHMGYTFAKNTPRETLLNYLCESLDEISKCVQDTLIFINIENDFITSDINRLGSEVEDFNFILNRKYPNLRLCYDVGHANIAFSNPYEYRKFIGHIQSFHIHNNWGNSDLHNPYGNNGSINMEFILSDLIHKNVFFILENELDTYDIALKNLRNSLSIIYKLE